MTERTHKDSSLHDFLALGQLEVALAPEKQSSTGQANEHERKTNEIQRLPMLLRMLSASQPLSSIPPLTFKQSQTATSSSGDSDDEDDVADPLVDKVVARLETVAASHAAAEQVDALTSYHAPVSCRKISRLSPLKRDSNTLEWDTYDLASVAASPLGPPLKKKRRRQQDLSSNVPGGEPMDTEHDNDDDEMSIEDDVDITMNQSIPATTGAPASDSQEATTTKSLMEIAKLVVASLKPTVTDNKDEEEGRSSLLLPVATDSLLSESASQVEVGSAGAVGGFDFGASVASLIHHAPVLRHEHVANALCRTAVPQSALLIETLGANCPSAVPCLLRGCIDAYVAATTIETTEVAIANTAKQGVLKLSSLSYRESVRACSVLQHSQVMVDVQLDLVIQQKDSIAVACLLNKHFSEYVLQQHVANGSSGADTLQPQDDEPRSTQTASDALSEGPPKKVDSSQANGSAIKDDRTSSLKRLLDENPNLLRKSLSCILDAIHNDTGLSGRTSILLRALSFLVLFGGSWKSDSDENVFTSDIVGCACRELSQIQDEIIKTSPVDCNAVNPSCTNDMYHRYLTCACLSIESCVGREAFLDSTNECLEIVLDDRSISLRSDVFSSKAAYMLKTRDGAGLCNFVIGTLLDKPFDGSFHDATLEEDFLETCKAASSNSNLDRVIEKGLTDAAAIEDLSALLQRVRTEEQGCKRADAFVEIVLKDPAKCERVLDSEGIFEVIEYVVMSPVSKGTEGIVIPRVLPVQLQELSLKIDWRKCDHRLRQRAIESQYILQLLYCLVFLQDDPGSPFAIDPRDFPLAETIVLTKRLCNSDRYNDVELGLKRFVNKFAPEALALVELAPLQDGSRVIASGSHSSASVRSIRYGNREALVNAIQEWKRNPSKDPLGCLVQSSFVRVGRLLTASDLIVTTVQSLVGEPNMPLPFMTYSGLCRDPLVIFKAPVGVWRCKGLLRIALFTLSTLLLANDSIMVDSTVASELLMSRDAIVVKCLIMASIGGGSRGKCLRPKVDSELVAMVRELVARRLGLVAQVVKQGRNDTVVDWIVEYVPEAIQDAECLMMLMSDRSSLTAADKLEAASAAIRIAIAHGSRNENAVKSLVYAALSRVVSSFFLVIGPVGVPLDALNDGDGADVTQVCRNATFRILGALQNVRGSQVGLRNECGLALQKLANLCKGESTMAGLSGSVAGRRKQVLKDIYDAVAKAANYMGSGIKL